MIQLENDRNLVSTNFIKPLQKCKGCGRMLKNKKKYSTLPEPKVFQHNRKWTIVKVCRHKLFHQDGTYHICGTHNYRKREDEE